MDTDIKSLGRVGVLMGGYSSEREISLKSGQTVFKALKEEGCDVVAVDIVATSKEDIESFILAAQVDVAFIALHGRLGEDGTIQSILEKIGIPYTGSGIKASHLALNKPLALDLFQKRGLRVPAHVFLSERNRDVAVSVQHVGGFPLIIKPAAEGSSMGIQLVGEKNQLSSALAAVWDRGSDGVLMEHFIQGRDVTVGILGEEALPVVEICSKNEIFDYESKYNEDMAEHVIPAQIPDKVTAELQSIALKAHQLLGCKDFSRADFVLDKENCPYILEVNTIPGFTSMSLLPEAARNKGISFNQLCIMLVGMAYGKKEE